MWLYERSGRPNARPLIAAWGTTLATARTPDPAAVQINTVRSRFEVAALPASRGTQVMDACSHLFGDRFNLADNLLDVTLANINPIAHAAETLPNLSRVDKHEPWALFDCLTPAGARLLEALDRERLAIAAAYGRQVRDIREHYHLSYHVPKSGMAEIAAAIHARFHGPPGPQTLQHRYVEEDVPDGLVICEALAHAAGVAVPLHTGAITLFAAACGRDWRRENRLLPELALHGLTPAQLVERCRGDVLER